MSFFYRLNSSEIPKIYVEIGKCVLGELFLMFRTKLNNWKLKPTGDSVQSTEQVVKYTVQIKK